MLFEDIGVDDIEEILLCLDARIREYEKDEIVIMEGDNVQSVGIVISGIASSQKQDASGKTLTLTLLRENSFVAIMLAANKNRSSPVTVQAREKLCIMFFSFDRLFTTCSKNCIRHDLLLKNYSSCLAEKALELQDRIECLIQPSVRDKVMLFLQQMSAKSVSQNFDIPFDRNTMADYLNVERSALSRELSRMKNDGMIDYYKSSFRLLKVSEE